MQTSIRGDYELFLELRPRADPASAPIYSERVTDDIADLVDETVTRAFLSDALPIGLDELHVDFRPIWLREPMVGQLEINLSACDGARRVAYQQVYDAGRWVRRAMAAAARLQEEGTIAAGESAFRSLVAEAKTDGPLLAPPVLEPPPIVEQTLDDFGVRELAPGSFVPDRPVLGNERMVEDILRATEAAGATETGGAVLGKLIRLPECLPGAETRVVTVLSASVLDERHVGSTTAFAFSPEALAAAAQLAELRGAGECVITAWHSHGWGCGDCNQKECLLTECTQLSLADYQVLESLFSAKSTLMPVAGRKLGAEGRRPVLEIHGWRGGQMRPLRWRAYRD